MMHRREVGHAGDERTEQLADIAEESNHRTGVTGFVIGASLTVAAVLLVVQNTATVPLHWLVFDVDGPMWTFIALAFLAGVIAGPLLVGAIRRLRRSREHRQRLIDEARSH